MSEHKHIITNFLKDLGFDGKGVYLYSEDIDNLFIKLNSSFCSDSNKTWNSPKKVLPKSYQIVVYKTFDDNFFKVMTFEDSNRLDFEKNVECWAEYPKNV